jgi:tetratricopeptide (TPR) repeat protein
VVDRAVWINALGRHSKARAMLEERLREAPDDGLAHYRLGSMLARGRRQWEEGIVHLRRAAELTPEQPLVWNDLGMALQCAGHAADGLAAFAREAELSNEFGAWMNVALSCLTLKRACEARDAAQHAQAIDPNDPLLNFLLSVCARRDGDDVEADQFLLRAERALQKLPPTTRKSLEDAGLDVIKEARRSR